MEPAGTWQQKARGFVASGSWYRLGPFHLEDWTEPDLSRSTGTLESTPQRSGASLTLAGRRNRLRQTVHHVC